FLIWSFTVLITIQTKYSFSVVKQLLCFTLILTIAFFSSFYYAFENFAFIRDITYLLKPIIGLLVGYQLCKNHIKNPFDTAIKVGVLLAIIHIIIVGYGFVFKGFSNIHQIRSYAGFFSDYEVYVIIMVLFARELGVTLSQKQFYLFLALLVFSSFLYLSRTNFIQFVILFFAIKGFFVPSRKKLIGLISLVLAGLVFYSAILYYNPKRNAKGIEAFLYKVKIAPTEPFKTKVNKEDYVDFNDNYRSVENIHTLRQMRSAGDYAVLFGKGLGSTIDLNTKVWLGDSELRHISVLHNGFMTVYLKSGVVGVLILFVTIILLFRFRKAKNPIEQRINYLLTGTAIFLFISYWVFMGFYFKADTKAILIGLLLAYSERLTKVNWIANTSKSL
ncbi:hypothetical protein, partial [Flavobacterium sp.]|uniref:hypothetical protein n=1 Tax=Flavobacterium sp. TaxID=239 RepID=UPI0037BE3B8B